MIAYDYNSHSYTPIKSDNLDLIEVHGNWTTDFIAGISYNSHPNNRQPVELNPCNSKCKGISFSYNTWVNIMTNPKSNADFIRYQQQIFKDSKSTSKTWKPNLKTNNKQTE